MDGAPPAESSRQPELAIRHRVDVLPTQERRRSGGRDRLQVHRPDPALAAEPAPAAEPVTGGGPVDPARQAEPNAGAVSGTPASEPASAPEPAVTAPRSRPGRSAEELLAELFALPTGHPDRLGLRRRIVESQLPLVHHLAQRFRGRGEPYDDLVQVGTIGLLNAVDRFDPERGSFTAFAVPTILGEIRRHFRDRGWAMRVPRRLQELGRRVNTAREELTHRNGRSPTIQELASFLDADPDLVVEALDTTGAYALVPLPQAPEDSGLAQLSFQDDGLELVENRATLRPLLARLPTRERTILALRFARGLSQSQIAAEVGVSQMHVSRLLARSLAALRDGLVESEDG